MLYIHKLKDFQHKSAEVESVYLIRELKQKTSYPLTLKKMQDSLSVFFVSETDKERANRALELIPPTLDLVNELAARQDTLYEAVNLQRTIQLLKDVPLALQNQLFYMDEIRLWQEQMVQEVTLLLNKIPKLRTKEEKSACNEELNCIFSKILRNQELVFNPEGIIHDGQVSDITGLSESLPKGYLFHISLEEELKKLNFGRIKSRIDPDRLAEAAVIEQNVEEIKKGIERAYEVNMRLINLALVLYSYVKWMMSGGS